MGRDCDDSFGRDNILFIVAMGILIATISILTITGIVWTFGKVTGFKICPICAGVSGTWLWMLIGMLFGQLPTSNFQLPTAILMGGSVVGLAYQFERHLLKNEKYHLLWKALFIPLGFLTVYSAVNFYWALAIPALLVLIVLALIFGRRSSRHQPASEAVEKLEEKMKKCC